MCFEHRTVFKTWAYAYVLQICSSFFMSKLNCKIEREKYFCKVACYFCAIRENMAYKKTPI